MRMLIQICCQLEEFRESLLKLNSGDLGLLDSMAAMQLTIQAAVSEAFRTPEILRLFARAQPDHLRDKLANIERDHIVGKMTRDLFIQQKTELLLALTKLKATLTEEEASFLETHTTSSMRQFTSVQENIVIKDGLVNKK